MNKLGKFAAACAVVSCAFTAWADYDVNPGNEDDAAAINAAIAAAAAEGGDGIVTLADGTYNLTAPVVLNAAVRRRRTRVRTASGWTARPTPTAIRASSTRWSTSAATRCRCPV